MLGLRVSLVYPSIFICVFAVALFFVTILFICAILRLDVKKRKLPVDLVKLAEIAISPDFALRLYAFVAPPDVDATCRCS
jgi:hypothetical protein